MALGDGVSFKLGYEAAMREFMRAANLLETRLGLPYNGTAWGAKPFGGDPMKKLAIFYSPPIAVLGGEFYADKAAEIFARYDAVVFPGQVPLAGITGIENPTNAFYASSLQVLQNIRLINPNTLVFGYIPMDIPYSHLTETQIQTSVNQCRDFGYDGIFWDTCGSEFGNTRSRQNNCVAMAHAAINSRRPSGMLSILNGFDPYDIYRGDVNTAVTPTSYPPGAPGDPGGLPINPTGAAPLVYPGDGILAESFAVNTDPSAANFGWANGWQNIVTLFNKQFHFGNFRNSLGIKVYGISVMPPTTLTPYTTKDALEYANFAQAMAYMFSLDFFGYGTQNYGGADQIIPVFPTITPFGELDFYAVQPFWTVISETLNSGGAIVKGVYRRQLYGTGVNHFIEVSLDDTVTPTTRGFKYLNSDLTTLYGGVSATAPPGSSVKDYKPGNNYGAAHDLVRHIYFSGYDKAARSDVDMLPTSYPLPSSKFWLCQYDAGGTTLLSQYGLPAQFKPSRATPSTNVEASVPPGGVDAYYSGDFSLPAEAYLYELDGSVQHQTALAHIEFMHGLNSPLQTCNRLEYRTDGVTFWIPIRDEYPIHGHFVGTPLAGKPNYSNFKLRFLSKKINWIRADTAVDYGTIL